MANTADRSGVTYRGTATRTSAAGTSVTLILAILAAAFCSGSLLCAFALRADLLPLVLVVLAAGFFWLFRRVAVVSDTAPLAGYEWAFLGYAALIAVLRQMLYTDEYLTGHLVDAITTDDPWHFQEVASLVTTAHFPPRLNYQPDAYLHYYYLAWLPAAAASGLLKLIGLGPAIKATYALDAGLIGIAFAFAFILFQRHVLPPPARKFAIIALFVAGAVPDGAAALYAAWKHHALVDVEWWQGAFWSGNQFSSVTSLFLWVPQHLAAVVAVLFAVMLVTEPRTLKPKDAPLAYLAAGLLLGFALFSSLFVVLGGFVALSPLLLRVLRERPRQLLPGLAVAALLALPLLYIYRNTGSGEGPALGIVYRYWRDMHHGSAFWGVVGIGVVAFEMILEVGWLPLYAYALAGQKFLKSPLGAVAVASTLFLLSTAVVSFPVSHNYAMRGSLIPMILLVYGFAWAASENPRGLTAPRWGAVAKVAFAAVIGLAVVGNLNVAVVYGAEGIRALRPSETAACQEQIIALNRGTSQTVAYPSACRAKNSPYAMEQPFVKAQLDLKDLALRGKGP
ncbi:MAG: hypothetical protein WDM91_02570 [Rhizomicrobium sp.]